MEKDYKPTSTKVWTYCIFSPCICCFDCLKNAINENHSKVIILILICLYAIFGTIIYIFYEDIMIIKIMGIILASFLPAMTFLICFIKCIINYTNNSYIDTERDLINLQNEKNINYIV